MSAVTSAAPSCGPTLVGWKVSVTETDWPGLTSVGASTPTNELWASGSSTVTSLSVTLVIAKVRWGPFGVLRSASGKLRSSGLTSSDAPAPRPARPTCRSVTEAPSQATRRVAASLAEASSGA